MAREGPKSRRAGTDAGRVAPARGQAGQHPDRRLQDFSTGSSRRSRLRYAARPDLDPQLVWKGKDEQDAEDLVVDAPPIYIQEKIDPQVLIENLRRTAERAEDEPELDLFDTFDGLDGLDASRVLPARGQLVEPDDPRRLTPGHGSLAEKENLRGKVQMIYIDPPYGIKFGSNWQVSTGKRDVKDGKIEDVTREVEQIKAFRDTWETGHQLVPRLSARPPHRRPRPAYGLRQLFVQIGDENVHLVRSSWTRFSAAKTSFVRSPSRRPAGLPTSVSLAALLITSFGMRKNRDR